MRFDCIPLLLLLVLLLHSMDFDFVVFVAAVSTFVLVVERVAGFTVNINQCMHCNVMQTYVK